MIPDPLKDWHLDSNNLKELTEALQLPIMQKAMAVLQFVGLPRDAYSEKGSAEQITEAAFEAKRNAGYFSYPADLWNLTEPPPKAPKNPEGYSDSYVKEYAKKKGLWLEPEEPSQPGT